MIKSCFLIVLLLIVLLLIINININTNYELFVSGYGSGYGMYYPPNPECCIENDCIPGGRFMGATYQNMCEPIDERLSKEPRKLVDGCLRIL